MSPQCVTEHDTYLFDWWRGWRVNKFHNQSALMMVAGVCCDGRIITFTIQRASVMHATVTLGAVHRQPSDLTKWKLFSTAAHFSFHSSRDGDSWWIFTTCRGHKRSLNIFADDRYLMDISHSITGSMSVTNKLVLHTPWGLRVASRVVNERQSFYCSHMCIEKRLAVFNDF